MTPNCENALCNYDCDAAFHASAPKPIPPGDLRPAPSTAEATALPDGVSTWEFLWGRRREEVCQILSEACVEIGNLDCPENVVARRCWELRQKLEAV